MNIILEYSEEQGAFHNNDKIVIGHSFGWKPLGEISEEESFGFVQYIRRYFIHKNINFEEMKELFDNYFKTK